MTPPKTKWYFKSAYLVLILILLSGCLFKIMQTDELPVNLVFTYPKNHATNLPTIPAFAYQIYVDVKNPQKIMIFLSDNRDLIYPSILPSEDVITLESSNCVPSGSSYPTEEIVFIPDIILKPNKQYFWRYKLIGDNWNFISNVKDFTTTSISYKLEKEIDFYKVSSIGFTSNNYLYIITDSSLVILDENLNEVLNTKKFLKNLSDIPYYSENYMIASDLNSIYKTTSDPSPEILWHYTINSAGNFKAAILSNNTIFILNNDIIINETSYATGILLDMDGTLIKQKTYKVDSSFVEGIPSIIKETNDEIITFSKDSLIFARFSKNNLDLISYKTFGSMQYAGDLFLVKSDKPFPDYDYEFDYESNNNGKIYKITNDGSLIKIINIMTVDSNTNSPILLYRCTENDQSIICFGNIYSHYFSYKNIIARIENGKIADFDFIKFPRDIDLKDITAKITKDGSILLIVRISPYEGINYGILLLKKR